MTLNLRLRVDGWVQERERVMGIGYYDVPLPGMIKKDEEWAKKHRRNDDPQTSHDAAESIADLAKAHTQQIRDHLRANQRSQGWIQSELRPFFLHIDGRDFPKRVTDARSRGKVEVLGVRKSKVTNRDQQIYSWNEDEPVPPKKKNILEIIAEMRVECSQGDLPSDWLPCLAEIEDRWKNR